MDPAALTEPVTLPEELIDIILACLNDAEDRPSLIACARVCQSWAPRCQAYLYHRVDIKLVTVEYVYPETRFFRFLQLLQDEETRFFRFLQLLQDEHASHIGGYIKEATFTNLKARHRGGFDRDFELVLSFLTNLTHLTLQFEILGYDRNDYVERGSTNLKILLANEVHRALLQMKCIEHVSFLDIGALAKNIIPLLRVCEGTTTRRITIAHYTGSLEAALGEDEAAPFIPTLEHLDLLSIFYVPSCLEAWLVRPIEVFPNLRVIVIEVESDHDLLCLHQTLLTFDGLAGLSSLVVSWNAYNIGAYQR